MTSSMTLLAGTTCLLRRPGVPRWTVPTPNDREDWPEPVAVTDVSALREEDGLRRAREETEIGPKPVPLP
jgi:hypothetical protein